MDNRRNMDNLTVLDNQVGLDNLAVLDNQAIFLRKIQVLLPTAESNSFFAQNNCNLRKNYTSLFSRRTCTYTSTMYDIYIHVFWYSLIYKCIYMPCNIS